MAREVKVQFGGAERVLHFDARDGIEIKKKLGKKPKRVLDEDLLMGIESKAADGTTRTFVSAYEVDLYSLAVVLWHGITHDLSDPTGRKRIKDVTEDVVIDWLSEYMETQSVLPLAKAIEDAFYLSGVMGNPIDFEEAKRKLAEKKPDEEVGDGEGKETPSTVSPNP
jgi:hypothetical protein